MTDRPSSRPGRTSSSDMRALVGAVDPAVRIDVQDADGERRLDGLDGSRLGGLGPGRLRGRERGEADAGVVAQRIELVRPAPNEDQGRDERDRQPDDAR